MAEWSFLGPDYPNRAFDTFPFPYYQDKESQPAAAQCLAAQAQPFQCPSPTLTVLLSPAQQGTQQLCEYNPAPKVENPRELRNKAEKQRRDKMNESVARLASIVPPVVKPGRKMNKRNVLRLAAHYLRSHQHVFGSSIDRGPEFSSAFTQTLLKTLKGFLITTTYKGIIVVVSPNIQEYLGYTELELLGQDVTTIIHKEDHQLLADQLFPRSCNLTSNGQLLLPREKDAEKAVAEALCNEKRSFIIRFKRLSHQRSEPPQYVTCHVEGSLRKSDRAGTRFDQIVQIGRRVRSRGENPFSSGNDIVFVGMVRPTTETFINESALESFRMEYRTRHSIDGEIIQCEQRIALVTGYMTHEVNGVNAMNFMHRDDVRWVIIALREMYDEHRLVGESCYRLMTKNGQFIYMRTLGRLDVDKDTKAVTSFVCTNTVVAEQEGKHLIKLMKKKFTLMINNGEEKDFNEEEKEEYSQEDSQQSLPVEDPRQLEKVILHLVTNLPSPDTQNPCKGEISSHLAIIPPKRERIQRAIEKSYSVIKTIDMAGNRERRSKNLPSTVESGKVARNQMSDIYSQDDHSDIIRALCLGICQGPSCTCTSESPEGNNHPISPTENDLYMNYFANTPPNTSVDETSFNNLSDSRDLPIEFNINNSNFSSDLFCEQESKPSYIQNIGQPIRTERINEPAQQSTNTFLGFSPSNLHEHPAVSPSFCTPNPYVDPTPGTSVEDSYFLERGRITPSNTILGDDELVNTINRIEAEDGVDSRNLVDCFSETEDVETETVRLNCEIERLKKSSRKSRNKKRASGRRNNHTDIYEFKDDETN
ncbi:hypoxia-inducible factor 1-alpha-like isoform X2 [Nymphalis io]|uniref:hypoxia-inducible factor 1-alpha-like isoform X2 n=1 Tax=Inachis io TaxID=171585 RepID=UPI0021678CA7|nr:hypoxia-inducible factor 1-alpha-like isoform X2 [Nymphalis io]